MQEIYKQERDIDVKNRRNDGITDLLLTIIQIFNTMKNNIISKISGFALRRKLELLANLLKEIYSLLLLSYSNA